MWFDQQQAIDAFRTVEGVARGHHHPRLHCGSAAFFRNAYRGALVNDWLPALDGIEDKLNAGARVADVGCGHGYSSIIMAEAFPNSHFMGFDVHEALITAVRENAEAAGVADRVTFEVAHAGEIPAERYD